MAIIKYKPITNGRRNMTSIDYSILSKTKPFKPLLKSLKRKAGRNNQGKITVRHKGSGHKRKYRIIDFKRNKLNIKGIVKTIEYDPNRNCFISLIAYLDGEKRYIIHPKGLKINDHIISGNEAEINIGNCLQLKNIPEGTLIHNIELKPNQGAKLVRSAGTYARVIGTSEDIRYIIIKLASNEVRKILGNCRAVIGVVDNEEHNLINIGKAGRNRNLGIRPTVRGSAMNPNDHPHGGGEGKAPIGRKAPLTLWGKKALGVKTRKKKKKSSKFIITTRNSKKR